MTYINSANTIEIDLADRIARNLSGLRASFKRARLARQTMRELNALSDRELDDLGIHRSAIKAVAYSCVADV